VEVEKDELVSCSAELCAPRERNTAMLSAHLELVLVSREVGGATVLSSDISPGTDVSSSEQGTRMQQIMVPQSQSKVLVQQAGGSVQIVPPITEEEWYQRHFQLRLARRMNQ
jgi:hypothetical protein